MFDTSKDVLFIVLAVSAGVLTFFISWGLYYVVMLLKKTYATVKEVSDLIANIREKLDRLEQLFNAIEDKIKHSASYLPLLMKGMSELLEFFKKKKEQRAEKRASKKTASK